MSLSHYGTPQSEHSRMTSLKHAMGLWLAMLPFAAVFLLFYSPSTSPLFCGGAADSNVFKTFGYALLQGKTLYADLFDNKGPVLFLIQALGLWLNKSYGIFVLQCIGLTTTLALLWRTARLLCSRKWAFVANRVEHGKHFFSLLPPGLRHRYPRQPHWALSANNCTMRTIKHHVTRYPSGNFSNPIK